jgi:MFS family permease
VHAPGARLPSGKAVKPDDREALMSETLTLARRANRITPGSALGFVVLAGVVSLFADMTYEGARSITGPYLALLGASGTVVGVVSGFGELTGYALRLASGILADRTGRYWSITIAGYAINLLAVPALALAGRWETAAALIVLERAGKALRTPARDAMLSHATQQMGRGWGFGLHEALDQIGAVLGPLAVALVLYLGGGYRLGFALLLAPALLALAFLAAARMIYPRPRDLEVAAAKIDARGFARPYWIYLAAVGCVAAGYADFPLIAYHFEKSGSVSQDWIPLFYAVAMGVDGVAAVVCGYLFDRLGLTVLIAATFVAAAFAPLVFFGGFYPALAGAALWGVGMGAQESIMRAAVANLTPADRRGTAFGVFNLGFGVLWFAGSAAMGALYDVSIPALVVFSVSFQIAGIPLFLWAGRAWKSAAPGGAKGR